MFNTSKIFEALIDFIYSKVVKLITGLFQIMNESGTNLFEIVWIKQIVQLFNNIGWILFATGLIIAVFEYAIESQNGRGDLKSSAINIIKGFFAVNLFTVLPVELFAFTLGIGSSMAEDMTSTINLFDTGLWSSSTNIINPIFELFLLIMVAYAIVKVMFDSLKRGGILLIQISVGSLYMLSVVRGFMDGFISWLKQIIALCLTTFLQSTMLTAGLLTLPEHPILGLGVMLSATEIPRIAERFGLDTSTKANLGSAVYTAQGAVNLVKTVGKVVAK